MAVGDNRIGKLARLKNLPPRPPQKPSGMDKATDRGVSGGAGAKSPAGEKSSRRRGSQLDKLTIDATVVVRAKAPAGSRHKGYEEIVVQDLNLSPQVTLYCRERWETPEGERIIAALDPGIVGGYGPNLHRFGVGIHALCWVHAERLVHKLVPANDKQRNAIEVAKRMIWWFYGSLKEYKLAPSPQQAKVLRARFDRIFNRGRTGYVILDSLLRRLFRHKDALLRVLDRPEIPLNTNASENDIRAFVTKRKISGGTVSDRGRDARDIMLGLAKTCMKLKLSFYEFLGDRLGIPGAQIPHLAELIRPAPS